MEDCAEVSGSNRLEGVHLHADVQQLHLPLCASCDDAWDRAFRVAYGRIVVGVREDAGGQWYALLTSVGERRYIV